MPGDAVIRDYRAGDEVRVQEIVGASLASYGLTFEPGGTDRDLFAIPETYFAHGGIFRVLEHDGKVVGSYGLHNEGGRVTELRKMYLDAAVRGRGFGRMMLEDALATARRLGFRAIVLESHSRLVEAAKLYRKYGFVDDPRPRAVARCDYALRLEL
jgi:putative acetyltransferase